MLVCLYKTKTKKKKKKIKNQKGFKKKRKKVSIKDPLENLDLDQLLQMMLLGLTRKTFKRNDST